MHISQMKMMMILWRNECNKQTARWRGMVLLSRDGFIATWFVMTFFESMSFSYFPPEGLKDYFNCWLLIFETSESCQIADFIWNYCVNFKIWIDICFRHRAKCVCSNLAMKQSWRHRWESDVIMTSRKPCHSQTPLNNTIINFLLSQNQRQNMGYCSRVTLIILGEGEWKTENHWVDE